MSNMSNKKSMFPFTFKKMESFNGVYIRFSDVVLTEKIAVFNIGTQFSEVVLNCETGWLLLEDFAYTYNFYAKAQLENA